MKWERNASESILSLFSASFLALLAFSFQTSSSPSVDLFMITLCPLLWLPLLETIKREHVSQTVFGPRTHKHTRTLPLPSASHSPWRRRKETEAAFEAQMPRWQAQSPCKPFQPYCPAPTHEHTGNPPKNTVKVWFHLFEPSDVTLKTTQADQKFFQSKADGLLKQAYKNTERMKRETPKQANTETHYKCLKWETYVSKQTYKAR